MRRVGGLIEEIASADNLRLAWRKTIRGKRNSPNVLRFSARLEENLRAIGADLLSGRYVWDDFYRFTIYDPKEREIKAPRLRDRVAFHALMNVCEPTFDRVQYFSSCACRKGRGHFAALEIAARHTRSRRFFLKNDVRKYFDSIPHDLLKESLQRLFKDQFVLKAFFDVVDVYHSAPGRGLPIGSLTSQFFANHYLNALDRFVYEELKVRYYVRYMDDFVLWSDSREELRTARSRVVDFARDRLGLTLKPEALNACRFGFEFLGFIARPDGLHLSRRARIRYRRLYRTALEKHDRGEWDEIEIGRRLGSATEYVKHAWSDAFLTRVFHELGYGE